MINRRKQTPEEAREELDFNLDGYTGLVYLDELEWSPSVDLTTVTEHEHDERFADGRGKPTRTYETVQVEIVPNFVTVHSADPDRLDALAAAFAYAAKTLRVAGLQQKRADLMARELGIA